MIRWSLTCLLLVAGAVPAVALEIYMTVPDLATGAVSTSPATLAASASSDVVAVQFRVNGVDTGAEDTSAPFSISLALANGTYTVSARARTSGGQTKTSAAVPLTVRVPTNFSKRLGNGGAKTITAAGQTVVQTVTATLSGTLQPVWFTATNIPSGSIVTFDPAICSTTCVSTMTLTSIPLSTTGSWTVTAELSHQTPGGLLTTSSSFTISTPVRPAGEVRIDLGASKGAADTRATGVHNALIPWPHDPNIPPSVPLEMVTPLKPRLLRDSHFRVIERHAWATSVGAVSEVVLSNGYNNYTAPWPGDNHDWVPWTNAVAFQLNLFAGIPVQWDVWNEPNQGKYWMPQRPWMQFLEMWRRTYQQVRAAVPTAKITGPSTSVFDRALFESLLDYSVANNTVPDRIGWHANGGGGDRGTSIQTDAHAARFMLARKGITRTTLEVNEYAIAPYHVRPGNIVHFIAHLEEAGIERAAHSCWRDVDGSGCQNASIASLLTPANTPRPVWWAFRWYADRVGTRVMVMPTGDINGVAAYEAGAVRALLGNAHATAGGSRTVTFVNLDRAGLSSGTPVRVRGIRTDTRVGEGYFVAQAAPVPGVETTQIVVNHALSVALPSFEAGVAYSLILQATASLSAPTDLRVRP